MIERENKKIDNSKRQQRRGFAKLDQTNVVDTKQEMRLKKDLVMKNRVSSVANSKNVYETYFDVPPKPGDFNLMVMGRDGLSQKLNNRYCELSSRVDNNEDPSVLNGNAQLGVLKDDPEPSNSLNQVTVVDARRFGGAANSFAVLIVGNGTDGQVIIGNESAGTITPIITVYQNNLYLSVPTSDPGISGAVWNDAGTLKIST